MTKIASLQWAFFMERMQSSYETFPAWVSSVLGGREFYEPIFTPSDHEPNDNDNIADLGDAQHRGHKWYEDRSDEDKSSSMQKRKGHHEESYSSLTMGTSSESKTESTEASSRETDERKMVSRAYRDCTPCRQDMIKQWKNYGIKWICGAYQRAWRSFKSECMMRYRNCQDGTMFVKIYDRKCSNNTAHGRHFFYLYRV